ETPDEDEMSREAAGHGDADNRTIWSALAILFPWQVRELFLPPFQRGLVTVATIAARLDLPEKHGELVMSRTWPAIYAQMVDEAISRQVVNGTEEFEFYDIYVGGKWFGSRHTLDQCEEQLRYLLKSA